MVTSPRPPICVVLPAAHPRVLPANRDGKFCPRYQVQSLTLIVSQTRSCFSKAHQYVFSLILRTGFFSSLSSAFTLLMQTGAFLQLALTLVAIVSRLDILSVELQTVLKLVLEAVRRLPAKSRVSTSSLFSLASAHNDPGVDHFKGTLRRC